MEVTSFCLHSQTFKNIYLAVTCVEPIERPPGGSRVWSGAKQYNDLVSYDCGLHARAIDPVSGDRVDVIIASCMWDKQWNYTEHTGCECKKQTLAHNYFKLEI